MHKGLNVFKDQLSSFIVLKNVHANHNERFLHMTAILKRESEITSQSGIVLTPCMLGYFFIIICCLLIYLKLHFSKSFFKNSHRVSNSLDQDQAQPYVGPDLGPDCLQRSSANDKLAVKGINIA